MHKALLTNKVILGQILYEMSVGKQGGTVHHFSQNKAHKNAKKFKEEKLKKDKKKKENNN